MHVNKVHIVVRMFFGFFIEGYVKSRKQNTAVVLKIGENNQPLPAPDLKQ
jgi:hypothetical protein